MRKEDGERDDGETVGFTFAPKMIDLVFVQEELAGAGRIRVFEIPSWRVVANVHVGDVGLIAANRHEGAFEIYASCLDRFYFSAG